MATAPIYASNPPYVGSTLVSTTVNTAYYSPGTTGQATVFTAGANGAQISEVDMVQNATPSSNPVVNLWRKLHGATTWYLIASLVVTDTNTKKGQRKLFTFPALYLNATESLTVTCTVATQHITIHAFGGNS